MAEDNQTEQKPDCDSPWKETIERFFSDFMRLFFPHIHKEFDWNIKPEFLDIEAASLILNFPLSNSCILMKIGLN